MAWLERTERWMAEQMDGRTYQNGKRRWGKMGQAGAGEAEGVTRWG